MLCQVLVAYVLWHFNGINLIYLLQKSRNKIKLSTFLCSLANNLNHSNHNLMKFKARKTQKIVIRKIQIFQHLVNVASVCNYIPYIFI